MDVQRCCLFGFAPRHAAQYERGSGGGGGRQRLYGWLLLTTGGTGARLEFLSRVHVCRRQKGRTTSFSVSEHIHTTSLPREERNRVLYHFHLHTDSTWKTVKPRS
ncbi:unnamed protein product, partial [Ectocarpus sp. 12 AP-2014]